MKETALEQITALEKERATLYLKQSLSKEERTRVAEIRQLLPNLWDLHRRTLAEQKAHPSIKAILPKNLAADGLTYTGEELNYRKGPRLFGGERGRKVVFEDL